MFISAYFSMLMACLEFLCISTRKNDYCLKMALILQGLGGRFSTLYHFSIKSQFKKKKISVKISSHFHFHQWYILGCSGIIIDLLIFLIIIDLLHSYYIILLYSGISEKFKGNILLEMLNLQS